MIQEFTHCLELFRVGANGDQTRLRAGDHRATITRANQGLQRVAQIGPVVAVGVGLDAGAIAVVRVAVAAGRVAGAGVVAVGAVETVVIAVVIVVGGDPAGTDRGAGEAAPGHHQIVDRNGLGPQTGRVDVKHIALALHIETVHVTHHRQHLLQGDVLELNGDQPGDSGVHCHAVAGSLEQGAEKLDCLHVVGGDAQPLFRHGHGGLRPVQLQQFALHRFGQGGQGSGLLLLFAHGLLEGVLGLGGLRVSIRGTAGGHHGHGDQTETVCFHVINAP